MTENFETQAVGGQLPAEESTVPINNQEEKCKTGFDAEAAVEQLTAEEKNIRQARREPDKGDTIQEEDSKQASKEGYIQEYELQHVKVTKASWKKIKGYFTGRRPFYCLAYLDILKLLNHFLLLQHRFTAVR